MNTGFTLFFYGLSAILLSLSFRKDREKTNRAVKKAVFMMLGVLPYFLTILLVTGTAFFILPSKTVQTLMGTESGIRGMLLAAVTGAAALVPVLAVFPVVSELLKNGAGTAQMAVFISTLTTVGIVTIPLEVKYMGAKAAVLRNLLFFLLAFATSSLLEMLL